MLLVIPWQSVKGIRLLDSAVIRDSKARIHFYRNAIVSQWILAIIAMSILWSADSAYAGSLVTAGLSSESLLVVGLAALALTTQSPLVPYTRERMQRSTTIRATLFPMRNILPRSTEEKQLWITVSFTAGICEEILFRGFLFYYAQSVIGLGSAGAVALSTVVFALGHVYQGKANVLRVAVIGAVLGIVFAITDNLVACMALHAFLDLGALHMDELVPADEFIGTGRTGP